MPSFLNKFGIEIAGADFRNDETVFKFGCGYRGLERAAVKSVARLGEIEAAYHGEISRHNGVYRLNGKTEIKAPDFVKMLNNFSVAYAPDYPLGLFKMSAEVKTNGNVAVFNRLNANIGVNNFAGTLAYQTKDGRNQVKTNLKINRFEFEKFFYNANLQKTTKPTSADRQNRRRFWSSRVSSQTKIDYEWLKNWDIAAVFEAGSLSFNNNAFTRSSGSLALNKGVLKLSRFTGENAKGVFSGELELNVVQEPRLNGKINIRG